MKATSILLLLLIIFILICAAKLLFIKSVPLKCELAAINLFKAPSTEKIQDSSLQS